MGCRDNQTTALPHRPVTSSDGKRAHKGRDMRHFSVLTRTIYLLVACALIVASPPSAASAAPAISLRSTSTGTNGAGGTTLVLASPAGTQLGDLLIAQIVVNSTATVITPPDGWTLILTMKSTSSVEQATFYKAASGAEP